LLPGCQFAGHTENDVHQINNEIPSFLRLMEIMVRQHPYVMHTASIKMCMLINHCGIQADCSPRLTVGGGGGGDWSNSATQFYPFVIICTDTWDF
jgi:hypothetical protein